MSDFKIIYGRGRFPIRQKRENGEFGCRGCGGEIPKGRKTWCSYACVKLFDPRSVLHAVGQRDKGICCECGCDTKKARAAWQAMKGKLLWEDWRKSKPAGAEIDHIVPFSEGGLTVLENMRTLCATCHKKRTRHWHGERTQKKKGQLVLI